MILKKMLAICKKNRTVCIDRCGSQMFLDGGCCGADITKVAPDWTPEDCRIALEIDPEEFENWYTHDAREDGDDKGELDMNSYEDLERLRYSLNMDGMSVQPFRTSDGNAIFVNMEYLSPFKDEGLKTYKFNPETKSVYICRDSWCIGIVMPLMLDLKTMKDFASQLFNASANSLKRGLLDSGGQVSFDDLTEE